MDKLRAFLSRAGDKPYRNYIARIIQNVGVDYVVGTYQIELGRAEKLLGIAGADLTSLVSPAYDGFVDRMRHKPPEFWERFSCREVVDIIREEMGRVDLGATGHVLSEDSGENLIHIFFLAFSFRFARDALESKVVRKAMGIKRSFFRR